METNCRKSKKKTPEIQNILTKMKNLFYCSTIDLTKLRNDSVTLKLQFCKVKFKDKKNNNVRENSTSMNMGWFQKVFCKQNWNIRTSRKRQEDIFQVVMCESFPKLFTDKILPQIQEVERITSNMNTKFLIYDNNITIDTIYHTDFQRSSVALSTIVFNFCFVFGGICAGLLYW